MTSIIKLIDHNENSKSWSVVDMLEDAIHDEGEAPSDKALLILLDDREGQYDVGYYKAGLSATGAIALAEVFKARVLGKMNIIVTPGNAHRWL